MEDQSQAGKNEIKEDYTYEDRLQVPYIEKKNGDEQLKLKNIDEAMKHYSKAVMSIKILYDEKVVPKPELEKFVEEVGIPANLNLSFCYMNKKNWRGAIPHLDRVIEYNNNHVKALYRRCLCRINDCQFKEADEDLIDLEHLIGGSPELEELETLLENKQNFIKRDESKIYKKMFSHYVKDKVNQETEQIHERIKDIYAKSPSFFKKIYDYTTGLLERPYRLALGLTSNIKSYLVDKPLQYCRRKIRKKE